MLKVPKREDVLNWANDHDVLQELESEKMDQESPRSPGIERFGWPTEKLAMIGMELNREEATIWEKLTPAEQERLDKLAHTMRVCV